MIKPIANDVMLNVKLLSNPKRMYKVKNIINLSTPRDMNMTIQGCQKPIINNAAVEAKDLTTNVAIILQTLKNKCVIHVNPAEQNMDLVQEHLGDILDNLRDKMRYSYDRVVGLIAGGKAYDTSNSFADKCVKFTDEVCEFMEKEHIPSTKLIEQKTGISNNGINIYSHRDNAVITGDIVNNFDSANLKTDKQIQKAGEEFFEIFEVSPQAPISFVDEILPMPSTNLRFLK